MARRAESNPAGSLLAVAATVLATIAVFPVFYPAFLFFWHAADRHAGRTLLGAVFWLIYAGMIAAALGAGMLVARRTHIHAATAVAIIVPVVAAVGFLALVVLEFRNECTLGGSFLIREYC